MIRRVTSIEDAADFLSWLGERRPILAIDTETGGLEWWRQPLRLVQFGDTQSAWVLSYRDWRGVIESALAQYDRPVCFHNAPFDLHFLDAHGLPLPALHLTHDSYVMSHLTEPGLRHGLKPIAVRLFGEGDEDQSELAAGMKANGWTWGTVPEDFPPYTHYAGQDTILTARVAEALWPKVAPYRAAYDREMAVQAITYRMERRGVLVDLPYAGTLRDDWRAEMLRLKKAVPEFDFCNGKKLQSALLLDGWEPNTYTPTGKISMSAEALEEVNHPYARMLRRYKRLEKWAGTYLDRFVEMADDSGRLHANVRTLGATTGRMSISSPPLHQLPRGADIRNCILPDEDEWLWNIDYSTMEMRMFAHLANEDALIKAAHDGLDFHKFTAAMAYEIPIENVTAAQRQVAKSSVSFGKLFGAGPDKVAAQAGVPLATIERFLEAYAAKFPGVERFMKEIVNVGRQRERTEGEPYIITWGGRRVAQTDGRVYALVNYAVQGGCADLFKEKVIALDAAGYGDMLRLLVHDSTLLSVPVEMEPEIPKIKEILEDHEQFRVPFTVDVSGPLSCWGEEKK